MAVFGAVLLSGCGDRDREAGGNEGAEVIVEAPHLESRPLASASSVTGRFELLDAEETGIDFRHHYDFGRLEDLRYLNSPFCGGGVAIGDYDGDGRPDVCLTRAHGGLRLYRNLGGFRFQDVTEEAGLKADTRFTSGVSFVDLDGDGRLDLYVCVFDGANELYMNRGASEEGGPVRFEEKADAMGLAYYGASVMMAFADYDLDGDLDGYLLTNRYFRDKDVAPDFEPVFDEKLGRLVAPKEVREKYGLLQKPDGTLVPFRTGEYDHLYRNDGDRFTDVSEEAGIDGNFPGIGVIWWDYDEDGNPDLYAANDYNGPDQLYRNKGDGTFEEVIRDTVPYTPWFSMGVDTADIDNDGRIDLLASDMAGTTHYKEKMSMGSMEDQAWFLDGANPRQYMRNMLYRNTGTGRMMEVAHLAGISGTDWTWGVKFADFDSDGWQDLYVTNGMSRNFADSDMPIRYAGKENNILNWIKEPVLKDVNMAFRNLGGIRFENVGEPWGLDLPEASFGAATGDLDGDGDLDIVANVFQGAAAVYRNDVTDAHRIRVRLVGSGGNRWGVGASVTVRSALGTQTKEVRTARGFASSDEPLVHFGLGDDSRVDELVVTWPGGGKQRFAGLGGGRLYTITQSGEKSVRDDSPGAPWFAKVEAAEAIRHRERPFDDFARQPLLPNKLSQLGPGLAWGDVDGDGLNDLYVGGAAGQPGSIYFVRSGGRIAPHQEVSAQFQADALCEDMGALFFDADLDGDQDLYVVSGGVECDPGDAVLQDRLYLNDGKGKLRKSSGLLPDLRDSGSVVCGADFDRDGDLDLFVGSRSIPGEYPRSPVSRLLRNDGGRFQDATEALAPGMAEAGLVTGALWSDVNDDGFTDLLVTCEYGPVRLFLNRSGTRFEEGTENAGLSGLKGWWNGIAAADLDGDGDFDYAVTNCGLNTKYGQPSPKKPLTLYYGDFFDEGANCIVEAKNSGGRLLPVRGKSCSTQAMPALGERFKTFHDFASADLLEIYPSSKIEGALHLQATELRSGVFWNESDSSGVRLSFHPLPHLAQAAPAFGVAVSDVDLDGHQDLVVVQNTYSPQRETGRMAGGLGIVLRGDGKGTFTPVPARESGLVIPEDAVALTINDLDRDGRPDVVASVNNGGLKLLTNRNPSSGGFRIELVGRPGNTGAIGAVLSVTGEGAAERRFELHAGSGHLSQGPAEIYFAWPERAPAHLRVRWPSGQITNSTLPAGRKVFRILEPRD